MRWVPLILLAACAGSEPERKKSPAEQPKLPSPYVADEDTVPAPTADLSEIEAALQAGIDAAPRVTPAAVRLAYDAAMTTSDPYCPYFFSGPDGDYWFDECTSEVGSAFAGYAFGLDQQGVYDPVSGGTVDTWYVAGAATVETSGSELLVIGGTAYEVRFTDGVSTSWQSVVQGTFTWDGVEADGTWLATDYDPDLVRTFVLYELTNGHAASFDGGIGRLGPDGQWSIAFDNAVSVGTFLGSPCADEPSGTLSVRAEDGSWYDIRFHGPDGETFETSGACDGCGDVFYKGEPAGEACADFSTWLGWGAAPW